MEILDCEVCFNRYDAEKRVPRTLNCGHSLCTKCITEGITDEVISCPFCRASCHISSAGDISANFTLLKIVEAVGVDSNISLKSTLQTPPSLVYALEPTVHAGICQDHGAYMLFFCVRCEAWLCRDCSVIEHPIHKCNVVSIKQALNTRKKEEDTLITKTESDQKLHVDKLKNYIISLVNSDEEANQQINELQSLIGKHQELKEQLKDTKEKAENCIESRKNEQEKLLEAKKTLDNSETVDGVKTACQESQQCRKNVEAGCKSSSSCFQSDIVKKFNEFRDRVKLGIHVAESLDTAKFSAVSSFLEFLTKVKENEHKITREELLILLKFSTIWTVKDDTGEAAFVTNEENQIHLETVQENIHIPADVIILKHEYVESLTREDLSMAKMSVSNDKMGNHVQDDLVSPTMGNFVQDALEFPKMRNPVQDPFVSPKMGNRVEDTPVLSKKGKGGKNSLASQKMRNHVSDAIVAPKMGNHVQQQVQKTWNCNNMRIKRYSYYSDSD